jgi:hypothetical protein
MNSLLNVLLESLDTKFSEIRRKKIKDYCESKGISTNAGYLTSEPYTDHGRFSVEDPHKDFRNNLNRGNAPLEIKINSKTYGELDVDVRFGNIENMAILINKELFFSYSPRLIRRESSGLKRHYSEDWRSFVTLSPFDNNLFNGIVYNVLKKINPFSIHVKMLENGFRNKLKFGDDPQINDFYESQSVESDSNQTQTPQQEGEFDIVDAIFVGAALGLFESDD